MISILRFNIPHSSQYKENTKEATGTIIDYQVDGDYLKITIKAEEKLIGTYYFKTKEEKERFLSYVDIYDKIQLKGQWTKPKENKTEGLFDYKEYLKRQGIYYIVEIKEMNLVSKKKLLPYKIYCYLYKRAKNPYVKAFILGDTKDISSESISNYREIGISHLFAISGMHISLLSMIFLKGLKQIGIKEEKRTLLTGLLLLFYLFLTGLSPSVLRAVLFFLFFSINRIYYFYIEKENIFLLVLSLSLLINPYYIYEIGFLYSYSISFSLLLLGNLINRQKSYLKKLFMTSLISFIVSIPITLYFFNQLNILSIFYNLLFVPLVSILIFPSAIITLILPSFEFFFQKLIFILEKGAYFFQKISFCKMIFPSIPKVFYFLYILFITFFFLFFYQKKKRYLIPLSLLLMIHFFLPSFSNTSYLIMIDVGQGDSILIHSKGKTMLIDTGGVMTYSKKKWQQRKQNSSIVKNTTIPLLKKLGIKRIDELVLTHGDYDHLGEAINLIEQFPIRHIYINTNDINTLEENIIRKHPNCSILKENNQIKIGEFEFLSLNNDLEDENDSSIILFGKIKDKKLMLMGDASIKSEQEVMKRYSLEKVDILKVGHHGSKTSSSEEFLKTIKPKIALISAGIDNKFNHPHKEVITRLKKLKIKILSTQEYGSIKISF